jgi:multisubunit Na+/H+ antiporter MnhG subunit
VISWALLAAGSLIVVASAVGTLLAKDFYRRLHWLTPVTTIGGPLIGLALAIANGWSLTTAIILLTVGLLAITAPVLTSTVGRVGAQHDDLVGDE